jgi:hypothetical protein
MMRSPEQQFAMAKGLPIPELAKVLQGQSDIVDMSIAEMVLRQKMQAQKAQQGMAAQPLAQAPKVVEQDLMQAQQMMQPQAQPMSQPMMDQGVAGLPVGGIGELGNYEGAGGGIVSFDDGGAVRSPIGRWWDETKSGVGQQWTDFISGAKERLTTPTPAQAIYKELERNAIKPWEAVSDAEYKRRMARQAELQAQLKTAAPDASTMPADVASGEYVDKMLKAANVPYEKPAAPAAPEAPKADRPPVAIRPAGYDAVFQRARDIAGQISPQAETAPTITEAVDQQKQALQAAGYDFNLLKDQMAQIRAEKEQTKTDRKEAVNLRLLEAGLGILGGESPYAFVNIGKGASPALKGLSEDIKDIKKIDRERDKALRDLAVAENQVASGMGLGALKTRDAAQERIARANESRATREASIFSTITSAETQRYIADQSVVASKEGKVSDADSRRYDKARDAAIKLVNEGTMKFKSTAEREAEISRLTSIFYQQALDAASGKVPAQTSTFAGWGTPRVKQ